MEAREAHDGPDREETDEQLHSAARTLLKREHKPFSTLSPESEVCGHAAKNKGRVEGQRHDERVEESVVAFAHAVPHPRAVMVETLHTVVAHSAVRGARRSEHLTRGAVLQFDHGSVDEHLTSARCRLVTRASTFIDLLLDVGGLLRRGSGQDSGVTQGRLQQSDDDEDEEHPSNHRNEHGQMLDKERTVNDKEEAGGDQDEPQSQRQDSALPGHHDASVAKESVFPRKHLPLPPGLFPPVAPPLPLLLLRGWSWSLGVDLLVVPHGCVLACGVSALSQQQHPSLTAHV